MNNPQQYTKLIALTLAGSREAYSELYEITIQDVYKTVHFLIGDPSDVDDVVQEIYIQVHRSLPQFDINRPFPPWLMGLVMRQILAYRRKRWTHLRITKKAEEYEQTMTYDFSHHVVDKLSNHSLLSSVEHLPYKLKHVVILHYLSEYSQEEVAIAPVDMTIDRPFFFAIKDTQSKA
ncbi:sigma-70 family RNA polymerase sigma factor [Paenibacillus glacialis]|uniref:RNA polymerase subunit sigma n=1 Tax=Paenibacillus glacialis TaxID=494026 RepID=A0A168N7B0_9BACL|nr:sigma-70 family RNA polymerase sigma factor [Paenibacillus glacialis]OAB45477.1 RNA polymerase subunit sigma [Paenibacillus glacialis]